MSARSGSATLLDAIYASLTLATRSPEGVADPVALLWPDADGQWRPMLAALQKAGPHLLPARPRMTDK